MREVKYLSPTSISLFKKDRDQFYINYLCESRVPRFPQTQPMSIGSAFDAYVKAFLHEKLFGIGNDPKYSFEALFEAQVEVHNRDWARVHGNHAFGIYKSSGALADLMLELQSAIGNPRFEIEVSGVIQGHREGITKNLGGVTLLGKPDVFYINKEGCHVILDFKVNGWCSKYNTSPMKGYCSLRGPNGFNLGMHKECTRMLWKGQMINVGLYLENLNSDWARQLCIYGWLCGIELGEEFITSIDQLICTPSKNPESSKNQYGIVFPDVRVAEHRLRITNDFQWKTFAEAEVVWNAVQTGHIFPELSRQGSDEKCSLLEKKSLVLRGEGTEDDKNFFEMTATKRNY